MAQTSVTITWKSGSATASLKATFTYSVSETSDERDERWVFQMSSIEVAYGGTTGSGTDLAKARAKREDALNAGIPLKFYFKGTTIVNYSISETGSVLVPAIARVISVIKTHSSQSVTFYASFNSKAGTKYSETIPAKTSYKVTYNGNGTTSPAAATKWYGEALILSGALTRAGYAFQRWNTNTSNTGTGYAAGAPYISNAAITLYAIWDAYIYYNTNGGSGGPGTVRKTYGSTHTVPATQPTRSGYVFKCWNTKADGSGTNYYGGTSTYSSNATLTLYAIWNPVLTFNPNGGSGNTWTATKTYGSPYTPTKPTRTNYQFKGWATSAAGTVQYTDSIPASMNTATTFYAVWELVYKKPKLSVTKVFRADSTGAASDEGTYASITVAWSISEHTVTNNTKYVNSVQSLTVACNGASAQPEELPGGFSGQETLLLAANMDPETAYTATVTLTDQGGTSTFNVIVPMAYYPLDILNFEKGRGMAVGAPATRQDVFEIGYKDTAFALNTNEDLYTSLSNLGWYSSILHSSGGIPSLKKLFTKILQRMTTKNLAITRTANSYVDATNVALLRACRKDGMLWFNGNISLSSAVPTGTGLTEIAKISDWSSLYTVSATMAGQTGGGAILVTINTSGSVQIANGSGASATGFHRCPMVAPAND